VGTRYRGNYWYIHKPYAFREGARQTRCIDETDESFGSATKIQPEAIVQESGGCRRITASARSVSSSSLRHLWPHQVGFAGTRFARSLKDWAAQKTVQDVETPNNET
jgi:hypothetical protein